VKEFKMKFPWKIQRKANTPAEDKLQQIKDILFPQMRKETDINGDMIFVDSTSDMNLHSIITDLQDGYNDKAIQDTLVDILKRLEKVRKILDVLSEFDPEAKYIIVENLDHDKVENIISSN
jgi:hypothetical protein